METDPLAAFTGRMDAEWRAQLRQQLWLLTQVREEVQNHSLLLHGVVTDNAGYRWRSESERGYSDRLAGLGSMLDRAGRELDAACDAVRDGLARLDGAE